MRRKRDKQTDILNDGETVGFRMMDARTRRSLVDRAAAKLRAAPDWRFSHERITNTLDSPNALLKPGYRVPTGGSLVTDAARDLEQEKVRDCYRDYEKELCDAWRDLNEDEDADYEKEGAGSRGFVGEREGDLCTINGKSGRLRKIGGKFVCVPTGSDAATVDGRGTGTSYAPSDKRVESRLHEIGMELSARGASDEEIHDYLADLVANVDAVEIVHTDISEWIDQFESGDDDTSLDSIRAKHTKRMDRIYQDRDAELRDAWRKG
jgi:hypothetical protein